MQRVGQFFFFAIVVLTVESNPPESKIILFALIPYQDIGDVKVDTKTGKKTLTRKLGIDGVGQLSIFIGLISIAFLYLAILT